MTIKYEVKIPSEIQSLRALKDKIFQRLLRQSFSVVGISMNEIENSMNVKLKSLMDLFILREVADTCCMLVVMKLKKKLPK